MTTLTPPATHDTTRRTSPRTTARVVAAVCLVLVPSLLLLVPTFLPGPDAATARELFESVGDHPAPYLGFVLQSLGSLAAVPAALAVLLLVRDTGRRGRVAAVVGVVVALTGALAMLVLMGMEFAQARVLLAGPDPAAAVEDALVVNEWPVFLVLLGVGLLGVLVTLPVLAVALARARLVPTWTPAVFALPVVVAFVPVGTVTESVVAGALVLACLVVSGLLLARRAPGTAPAVTADATRTRAA